VLYVSACSVRLSGSFLKFQEKSDVHSLFSLFIKHNCSKSKMFREEYYSTLRQRNGAWFDTRMGEGSAVTSIMFHLMINGKGQELQVQSRYLTATPRIAFNFYI
jgi:hypothetical protein